MVVKCGFYHATAMKYPRFSQLRGIYLFNLLKFSVASCFGFTGTLAFTNNPSMMKLHR